MKLYELQKIEKTTGKILFSAKATESGLRRMSAKIANKGRSDATTPYSQVIAGGLESGGSVVDPAYSSVYWVARCLGDDFKYCSSLFFPTEEQVARFMEPHR